MPAAKPELKQPNPLQSADGVIALAPSLSIMSANHVIQRLIGYEPKPGELFPLNKLFGEPALTRVKAAIKYSIKNGQPRVGLEAELLSLSGSKFLCNYSVYPIFNSTQSIIGAIVCFQKALKSISNGKIQKKNGPKIRYSLPEYHHSFENIIGKSKTMQRLFTMLPDIAVSDTNVLICGESGTGKDLIARAIHDNSLRAKGPYVAISCAAFAETLLESELFGHEKAAFTGADRTKPGRFEIAKGGTLFLDEIGELKPELQVKLLRILDQRKFERVGGTQSILMQARIISATNRNLPEAIKNKSFRKDFYYRLCTVPLTLPPLRERKEDIPLLVDHFIKLFNKKYNKKIRSVDTKVMRLFQQYHFPGNIRELEQAIEYAYVFVKGPVIFTSSLPDFKQSTIMPPPPPKTVCLNAGKYDREAILQALSLSGGKRQRAADFLGISRTSLWRCIKRLGLDQGFAQK